MFPGTGSIVAYSVSRYWQYGTLFPVSAVELHSQVPAVELFPGTGSIVLVSSTGRRTLFPGTGK